MIYRVWYMGVADESLIAQAKRMLAKKLGGAPYWIVSESNEKDGEYMVYTIEYETPEDV